jgi:plastocyanin
MGREVLQRISAQLVFMVAAFLALPLKAATVSGTVVIHRKLTPSRVTAAVPLYQRGTAVELGNDTDEDPLAIERGRVVVYIEGPGPSGSSMTAKMEQQNRRFVQETVVIPAGSRVSFPNLDAIFHNVFSLSKPKSFDLGNYPRGDTRTVAFNEPGIVYVNCHLHPNMTAAIVVTPNRWNTKADKTGHFAIEDVAPGKYTIVAWHKTAGFFRQTVEVSENSTAQIEFLIPLDADGNPLVTKLRK